MFVMKPRREEMPFLDHLEELRWRLLWSLLALVVTTVVGFVLVSNFNVLGILIRPIEPLLDGQKLVYLSPMDPFFITLKLAVLAGLMLASPIIVYQVWAFFSPALMPSEKRAIVPALYFGLVLFAGGVALAYYVVTPMALSFSMGFQLEAMEQNITAQAYVGVVTRLLLVFGLVFELPVVILVLAMLGIVTPEMLVAKRRYAIATITVLACVLTPGDVASSIFMMVPLFILYEFSILLARIFGPRASLAETAVEA